MRVKKAIGKIHLWLGLGSGLIVFIVSITGCIYVFESELRAPFEKYFTHIDSSSVKQRLPVSLLEQIGRSHLQKHLSIDTSTLEYSNATVFTSPGRSAYYYVYDERQGLYHYVYLHPATGELLHIKDMNTDFFQVVMAIHMRLLMPYEIGHIVVGVAVFIFVVSLITGIVLWWPKNKTVAKQRFRIHWKGRWRRINYDLHSVNGLYVLPLTLIISFTGLVWSFDWIENAYVWVANGGRANPEYAEVSSFAHAREIKPVDTIFIQFQSTYPEAVYYSIDFPTRERNYFGLGAFPDESVYYNSTFAYYDQYSGELLRKESLETMTMGESLRYMNYDIHVGKILGLPGQVMAFLASLIAASLPVTGFLIWWGRRNKQLTKQVRHDTGQGK
ncbi:MAG: PepSY domain-containing protein [Bacteroidetes bacterium]|nr:PepSY domain-containing protein [Bacteroidota bacterium]